MSKQTKGGLLVGLGLLVTSSIACHPAEPSAEPASALRQRFPEQAARVIEAGEGFLATGEGFAPPRRVGPSGWQSALIALPRTAEAPILLRGFGGAPILLQELDAEGEATAVEHAVSYRRAGGRSFWTAGPAGVEEWLHLEPGAADPAVTWQITGAIARQRGDAVELVDPDGVVHLSVTVPAAYAAGGRAIAARLVARGRWIDLQVDAIGEELLVDPLWVSAGSMAHKRGWFTSTRLDGGDVFSVGGFDSNASLASTERYDPATNAWSPAGAMAVARGYHTATQLKNDQVLVAGGCCSPGDLATAEIYTPATDTWASAGAMSHIRRNHTAALLDSGKVLVAGGFDDVTCLATAELYDPATNTWALTSPMATARDFFTATGLGNGKVLVVGGFQNGFSTALASAELYDPVAGTWSAAGVMSVARGDHTAALFSNGKVLVVGGANDVSDALQSAELYDPVTNTWSPGGAMSQARVSPTVTQFGTGQVLVAGGYTGGSNGVSLASAELYDPVANAWSLTNSMIEARSVHTATLVGISRVLVAGGYTGSAAVLTGLASAELYVIPGPLGGPCALGSECQSGFCADGVCCNAACNGGVCDACSTTAGAPVDGTCVLFDGKACDDGSVCTLGDVCKAGVCAGAPLVCSALDGCHAIGACDLSTGVCSNPAKPNNAPCDDGDACTQGDVCRKGVCKGDMAMGCEPPDAGGGGGSTTGSGAGGGSGTGAGAGGGSGTGAGEGGESSSGAGADASSGGCGCRVGGTSEEGGLLLGLGLLLALRGKRKR